MLDRITSYARCLAEPERWAVATIVAISGSSPSPVGTSMAVSADLEILGSLSGGCVESTTAALAQESISTGSARLESFGPEGGMLGEIPLTCGGQIQVLIQPLAACTDLQRLRELAAGDPSTPADLVRHVEGIGTVREIRGAASRLILSGIHDFSVHLATMALAAGWAVDLVEVRPAFATRAGIPAGAKVHVGDPAGVVKDLLSGSAHQSFTAVVVMTHHPDLDIPVLDAALDSPVGRIDLIGAMGSRRAQTRRDAALSELGHSTEARGGIRSPLGLDLGTQSPGESAVSMIAELVAAKNQTENAGTPLTDLSGPINRARPRVQSILTPAETAVR